MDILTKTEFIKMNGLWKRVFLEEQKRTTGKYSRGGDSDWVLLAWLKSDVWWDGNAVARYEGQPVPEEAFLWTDTWSAKIAGEKPSLDAFWSILNEGVDAVYYAVLAPGNPWTFVLTHEDLPARYIYSEKSFDEPLFASEGGYSAHGWNRVHP